MKANPLINILIQPGLLLQNLTTREPDDNQIEVAVRALEEVLKIYSKQILESFKKHMKNGLIPNLFGDRDSQPAYNSVDASLWFIDRVYQYMKYTNDMDFLENNWQTMENIIQNYKNGTDYNIFMDEDYLISHDPGLTWMDVKIGDYHPTPRCRKAVEIQALWYNALMIMNNLAQDLDKNNFFIDLAEKVEKGEGTLGKLVSDDQLMKEAEKTMRKIQKAAESIEEQTPITVLGTIIGIFVP
jgi:predicted glycogen debranching enzyme